MVEEEYFRVACNFYCIVLFTADWSGTVITLSFRLFDEQSIARKEYACVLLQICVPRMHNLCRRYLFPHPPSIFVRARVSSIFFVQFHF